MNEQFILEINQHGTKYWKLNRKLHREDGPAVEYTSGTKWWYLNGSIHRVDGPAIIFYDGIKLYYLNDREYSYEEWFSKLTPDQQYNYLWNLDEE